MGLQIIESAGTAIPARRRFYDLHVEQDFSVSARSRTPRSFPTAIRADIGESEGYKQALLRGEIGLQQPMGANVRGVDFITAVRDGATGIKEVLCTDVKTSIRGKFPKPKVHVPGSWLGEVDSAVSPARLHLRVATTAVTRFSGTTTLAPTNPDDLRKLEASIVAAVRAGRVSMRQLNANYSPAGQGTITGW